MKQVLGVHSGPRPHWVGDGFPVRSLFSYNGLGRELSPFLMLDHAAPTAFEPAARPRGVGQHPHRGFETVTIVYQGEVEHKDSTGAGGRIGPGDVQWMTAGGGLIHEEFHSHEFTRRGGTIEMVQLWVNLPARDKMTQPRYQTILDTQIPTATLADEAGKVRVIAGEFAGIRGPASTFTPMNVWDMRLQAGRLADFTAHDGHTLAIVVLHGLVRVNGVAASEGQLIHLDRDGTQVRIEAETATTLVWLAGEPISEPIVGYGPFVMNTEDEIRQAIDDFNSGRFGRIAAATTGGYTRA
jgi:redox-sensitive bicupin YhaK (pirin superfamily)